MAKERTAILLLKKEWANSAAFLINEGKLSQSTAETHILFAPFDRTDEQGVWIKEITSHQLTQDRSCVTMTVFVPWWAVLGLGIVDEAYGKVQIGFGGVTASDPT